MRNVASKNGRKIRRDNAFSNSRVRPSDQFDFVFGTWRHTVAYQSVCTPRLHDCGARKNQIGTIQASHSIILALDGFVVFWNDDKKIAWTCVLYSLKITTFCNGKLLLCKSREKSSRENWKHWQKRSNKSNVKNKKLTSPRVRTHIHPFAQEYGSHRLLEIRIACSLVATQYTLCNLSS